ncbi:hypothetical protein FQN60_014496, partial [Etheostoma spectabile]
MFAWGEDSQRGFRLKDGSNVDSRPTADNGVHPLNVSYHITDLSGGHNVLAFVKSNGNAFIIRTNVSKDGRRARGKQKFVEWKEKIQAVSCGDDVVTLLSERGTVLCVDATRTYIPRPLEALCSIPVCQVACGSQHSVALTKGASLVWGRGSSAPIHPNTSDPCQRSPWSRSLQGESKASPSLSLEVCLAGAETTVDSSGWETQQTYTNSCSLPAHEGNNSYFLWKGPHCHFNKDTADDPKVRNIFAGGNCSFATCGSNEDLHEETNNNVTLHCLDDAIDKWTSESFKKLVKKDNVFAELEAAVLHLLPCLEKKLVGVEGLRIYLLLNELLHVIQRHKWQKISTKLSKAVAAAVLNLSADSLLVI